MTPNTTIVERLTWAPQSYLEVCRDVLCWINSDDTLRDRTFLQVIARIENTKCDLDALARRTKDEPKNRGAAHGT